MSVGILSQKEFVTIHGTEFYTQFPTPQALTDWLNAKIDYKINNSPPRTDVGFFEDNRTLFVDKMLEHFYNDGGYLKWLTYWFTKKLSVNSNSIHKSMKKQGEGIKFITAEKAEDGKAHFRNAGGDEGRRLITNLSYKAIATCRKDKPVDILQWEAYNNCLDMKHIMRPAFWLNVVNGDFDGAKGPKKAYDTMMKLVAMFCDKASVFNPKIYATILNHYTPQAQTSLHLVGSWCTPALAAASLQQLKHQVIIDVIPRQKEIGEYINKTFIPASLINPRPKLDFVICPSEQLDARLNFIEQYRDYFDVQLFSPVYFSTELYNTVDGDAGEQSVESFDTYTKWIEGYFHETIKTAFAVMKPGSTFIIVISDFIYKDKENKTTHYISRDMLEITGRYFAHKETAGLVLTTGSGFTNKSQKAARRDSRKNLFSEDVHVFTKPLDGIAIQDHPNYDENEGQALT